MATEVNTAMVLAAGLGTRMRPLTADRPKPLVELNGQTLLERVIDRLDEVGISRVVVNVHYHADQIESALAGRTSPQIIFSDERGQLLDTGGGVTKALSLIGDQPFLIHNSDSVWVEGIEPNLRRLIDAWDSERMDCLMLLALATTSIGFEGRGDFAMAPDGRLSRRLERQVTPFVFTGVSIAHPRMFNDAPNGPFSLNLLWDRAIECKRLYGIRLEGFWMHVGTPSALAEAERAMTVQSDF